MNLYLHYDKLSEFKKQFYKDLLTVEHVEENQIQLSKLTYPDGSVDEANFWGYVLKKGNKKYLLNAMSVDGFDRPPQEILPILPKQLDKVAHQKDVFYHVVQYETARFRAEKKMSFREFVDKLCEFKHSNPKHQKLLCFAVLAQLFSRANFRFSTPAGFGKNSIVTTAGHLFGRATVITNPTRAKLEYLTTNKLLYVDEVVNIKKSEWELIEPFLLATGDHSPQVEKQTRAYGNIGETLDISDFSLGLFYNDIDHYKDHSKYFDFVPNDALLDRFPAMRLTGVFQEDFNKVKTENVKRFVKDNEAYYKDLIYTFTYFKKHLEDELAGFSTELLARDVPKRWTTNLLVLAKVIDLYSQSQDEFHAWMLIVNDSMADYKEMLDYPMLAEVAFKKLPVTEHKVLSERLNNLESFKERNDLLRDVYKTGRLERSLVDKEVW